MRNPEYSETNPLVEEVANPNPNDLLWNDPKETEFTSHADDDTYDAGNTIEDVILSLKESSELSEKFFKSFCDNQMQGNSGKCHVIISTIESAQIQIGESPIESTNCEKLLGVKIDSKLSFDKHIKTIFKKASNNLRALDRVRPYMAIEKKKVLMNSFSTFNLITVY